MQPFRANSFLQDPERNRLEMEKAARGIALSTNTKSPGVLFACQNSRSEALKHYTRCFDLNGGKKTRFDPTGDTVLISHTAKLFLPPLPHVVGQPDLCPDFGSLFPGAEMLALSGFDVAVGGIEEIESLLSQFTSLKTLVLVLNIPSKQPLDYLIQSDDELRYQTIEGRVAEFPERVKKLQHSSTELISNEAVFRSSSSR
jgi:hypothetical protein